MGSRLAIGAGLVAGILVGGLLVGGAVALLPPPPVPVVPTLSPLALATPSPTPSPSPSPAAPATASPTASPTATMSPAASPSPSGSVDFGIGKPAPSLRLAKAGGGTLDLAALRGKPVWVNFMATWCPECRTELPLMATYQARYAKTGLTIVLVDVKEPGTDVAGYLTSLGVAFPVGLDDGGTAAAAWRAVALPMHVWLTSDGVIAAGAVGSIGADKMAADLSTILPGVTVKP
jgi:thiol-disulfide isomerase/thioredoxin